ncbi:hypothetical protein ACQKWADRAFT_284792 [Trichoderma austrokoningii]
MYLPNSHRLLHVHKLPTSLLATRCIFSCILSIQSLGSTPGRGSSSLFFFIFIFNPFSPPNPLPSASPSSSKSNASRRLLDQNKQQQHQQRDATPPPTMSSPLTPPASMADLDRQHQLEIQAHLRLVCSPSPVPMPGQSAPGSSPTDKHPKGKRKRTATKDKMILEEAYSVNPKPDKQARLEIVNRVSLNEKEVQVCRAL